MKTKAWNETNRFVMQSAVHFNWSPGRDWRGSPQAYAACSLVLRLQGGLMVRVLPLADVPDLLWSLDVIGAMVESVVWLWPSPAIATGIKKELKGRREFGGCYALKSPDYGLVDQICMATTRDEIKKIHVFGVP